MKKEELNFILQEGEGQFVEFKENFDSKAIIKEIVAFANAKGGRIFLGIDDRGEIKGINIINFLKSQIMDLARKCDPPIKANLFSHENILIINVPEGNNKPYSCSQGFYLRNGPSSEKMKRDEILEFSINEGKIKFDEQINENFKWLKPEDFGKYSRARNQIIAELLSKTDYVEKLGTGINRIKNAMKNEGLPEPIFEYNYSFSITLLDQTRGGSEKNLEKDLEKLTENQRKIINLIKKNPNITQGELSKVINISEKNIRINISKLKQKGFLKRVGPDKGGYWEIVKRFPKN